jgi:hypothetical protein
MTSTRPVPWLLAACAAAVIAFTAVQPAAQAPSLPADVVTALARPDSPASDDALTLQAGRVVVHTQVAPASLEASVVSAVKINTTAERTLAYFRQLLAYVDGQVTLQYGVVDRPVNDTNFQALTLDPADLTDLRNCRAATCDIRVGAATVADVGRIGWPDTNAAATANAWTRQQLVSYVSDYMRRGDAALTTYDDRAASVDLPAQWQALVERATMARSIAPELQRYLAEFPARTAPEATDEFYWDKQRYTSLKPVIGLTHLVTWREAGHPERVLVAQKQIFASHYVFGALAVTLIVQDPAVSPPVTYVVYTNRTRGDLLRGTQAPTQTGLRARVSGLGATLQRRLGEQMIRQSAERLMSAMKEALER